MAKRNPIRWHSRRLKVFYAKDKVGQMSSRQRPDRETFHLIKRLALQN